MKIEELEIENYKCLNNKGMPLKFGDLNILIGENDSGKTSLLEVIEIIFKQKDIKKTMFNDLKKDLLIKVKFNAAPDFILKEGVNFQKINLTFNEYIKGLNTGTVPSQSYKDCADSASFIPYDDYLKFLKEFSFYNQLKLFFDTFIRSVRITGKVLFETTESRNEKQEEESDLEPSEGIGIYSIAYFDFNSELSSIIENLVKNKDFLNFMNTNLEMIDDFCMLAFNDFTKSNEPPKFIYNHDFLDACIYSAKKIGDKIIHEVDKDSFLFKFLKKFYIQKIFIDDLGEVVLTKIANLLSGLIHDRNSKVKWECSTSLQVGGYWLEGDDIFTLQPYDEPLDILNDLKNYEVKNIFGNYFIKKFNPSNESEINHLPLLKIFRTEVINSEIPYVLFNDLYGGIDELKSNLRHGIKTYVSEFSKNLNDLSLKDTNNKIIDLMKKLGEQIEGIGINIDIYNEKLDDLYFRIPPEIHRLNELIDLLFSPKIDFILRQGNKSIDLIQKSQGFLRKMLITDFLMLLAEERNDQNLDGVVIIDKIEKTVKHKIVLIEEPELHLHYNAQKTIMKLIKEKLSNSDNQVFITTHSHFIIENSSYENIYLFKKSSDSDITEIDNILSFNKDIGLLEKLQANLGLKKTDLLFLKKLIVIVEGQNDTAFIKGLCKRPEYGINPEEILFLNAEGQANINYYIGLGDFLKIKVLVIFDNHPKNIETKNRILTNPYKSEELTESIMKIIILDKPDILNYLDLEIVEKYFSISKNSINLKDNNLKDILFNKGKHLTTEDVEFLAYQISKVDNELENKIINTIKLFQVY